jgi:uncharacterized spore protein YtfJ
MGEIDKMVSSKRVVGDPIEIDGKTIIPLISVGFGFGAGGGSGKATMKQTQEGTGGGSGGAAGIRPIAVIISDEKGIRIEPIKGGLASAMEKIVETTIPMMMQKRNNQDQQSQSDNKEK